MDLFAESYDRIFTGANAKIGVMADIYISGATLELRDLTIYPLGAEALRIGPEQVRRIRLQVEDEIRSLGYRELRITADRLTGANPGKHIDIRRKL